MTDRIKVLFVCLGNICRSPTAAAAFSRLVDERDLTGRFVIDSAGTQAFHAGRGADPRSSAFASARGLDLSPHRARRVRREDFEEYDYIVAMDLENVRDLERACPGNLRSKISLFLEHCPALRQREVPDPYLGGDAGFENVLDLCESAAAALLDEIQARRECDD